MPIKINDILERFDRTVDQYLSRDEFRAKLRRGKPLRVKYSFDVRRPELHIGHAVNLWLLRELQDMGHKVVIVFGDFTARISDLDGRLDTTMDMLEEEIMQSIKRVLSQAKMILLDTPALLEVRRNSEWYSKMSAAALMNLFSVVTHARLISSDSFQSRIEEGREIYLHEFLYPVLQGFDSVAVQSDVAVLGSDRLFNESIGRFLQEKHKQKPQTLITTKIASGIDGRRKQSMLRGNHISLEHSPRDKFGRIMSIPDELIEEYLRLYTDIPLAEIAELVAMIKKEPREVKVRLASALVARYHGAETARLEREWFDNTISAGLPPEDLPTLAFADDRMDVLDLVVAARPDKSRGDSRRLVRQGGVTLNGRRVDNPDIEVILRNGDVLKLGKRNWFRIEIIELPQLESNGFVMRPMRLRDLDPVSRYIKSWGIVKYLDKKAEVSKSRTPPARDVFRKVLLAAEPRHEWLWTIADKKSPDDIIGVAHLRRDASLGNQNIWAAPILAQRGGMLPEIIAAINDHAFNTLGFGAMTFQEAFAFVTAPKEVEALRKVFMSLSQDKLSKDGPDGIWGFTREGWDQMQEWRRKTSPSLFMHEEGIPSPRFRRPPRPKKPESPKPEQP
jgi:tyrosyl-tRNA synthetase